MPSGKPLLNKLTRQKMDITSLDMEVEGVGDLTRWKIDDGFFLELVSYNWMKIPFHAISRREKENDRCTLWQNRDQTKQWREEEDKEIEEILKRKDITRPVSKNVSRPFSLGVHDDILPN